MTPHMNASEDITESAGAGWTPEVPLTVPVLLVWPPRPLQALKFLFGFPGLYFPWLALYALIALGMWELMQATGSDLGRLAAPWVLLLWGCNLLVALCYYGWWHRVLYGRRRQGLKFKYNPGWPKERDARFLFGSQTRSNLFWTLASGVTVWTLWMALTLWAQARGIAPVTSWQRAPVYCTILLLLLVFVHALHFYWSHRGLHWEPLYRRIHYLHHQNINPGPWSGLAMHPLEHVVYFSGVLLLWIIPATPLHVIYFVMLVGLAPADGHCGFGKMVLGRYEMDTDNYYHYLHHKFFRVNFGSPLLLPLDRLFGTFHDGTRKVPGSRAAVNAERSAGPGGEHP
jgi:sterol desaturase/sphingolipid hydroxylase (fatty acid hydroxylase superfamily)